MVQKPHRKSMFNRSTLLASSSLSSSGTEVVQSETTSPVVIGADTLVMPTASDLPVTEQKDSPTVLTEHECNALPRFTIRGVSCCGLMEVAGIQSMMHSYIVGVGDCMRRTILGLHASLVSQREHHTAQSIAVTRIAVEIGNKPTPENKERYLSACHTRDHTAVMLKMGIAGQFVFTYTQGHTEEFFKEFSKYVQENSLGDVWISPKFFYNPNSTREVRTVLWSLNNKGYWKYIKENLSDKYYNSI